MPTRRITGLVLLIASLTGWFLSDCGRGSLGERGRGPQRIVLITLDTLRADALTLSRADGLMPATGALAAEGLLFENFFATTSTTQPSHATLLTGRYPWHHGVTRNGIVLGDSSYCIAEELQAAGYSTHAVVASFPLHERFGFSQGFERFEDDFDEPYVQVWEGQPTEEGSFFSLARSVTERALAAIDQAEGERQFFWFHYFDPHDPYGDASDTREGGGSLVSVSQVLSLAAAGKPEVHALLAEARRQYDEDVRAMDRSLGRLYARLALDADAFDTHIFVTADHGESFGEKGAIGHGKRVTREQVQVPLVIHSPWVQPGVRREAASLFDVAGTMLSLVGRESASFGSRDLSLTPGGEVPAVLGMRRSFSSPKGEVTLAGRIGPLPDMWYFTVRGERLLSGNAEEILEEDDRSRPLAGDEVRRLTRFFAQLDERQASAGDTTEITDEDVQRALQAMGYGD